MNWRKLFSKKEKEKQLTPQELISELKDNNDMLNAQIQILKSENNRLKKLVVMYGGKV